MIRAFNPQTGEVRFFASPEPIPEGWIVIANPDYVTDVTGQTLVNNTPTFSVTVTRFNWEPWAIFGIVLILIIGSVKK